MMNSITRKLTVLSISSVLLVGFIFFSLCKIWQEQNHTLEQLGRLAEIERSVDGLRGQLWVFLQYGDRSSLDQVAVEQSSLEKRLVISADKGINLHNLLNMNRSLDALLEQERTLVSDLESKSKKDGARYSVGSGELLHARYNMLIQNMTDELSYLEQLILDKSEKNQKLALVSTLIQQLILSVLVCGFAFFIRHHFKRGFSLLSQGIGDLAKGNLDSRLSYHNVDSEFETLIKFFNQMKRSLQDTTYSKDELAHEVARQTSKLNKQKQQLQFLSEKDVLTGVLNRRAFKEHLQRSLINAQRTHLQPAILFIDLDDFKQVNDRYGHDAGDKVLCVIAKRLQDNLRESDFFGRLGGDEFLVCLDLLEDHNGVEDKAHRLIEALAKPILIGNNDEVSIGASVGVALYPVQADDVDSLINLADQAMYKAKFSNEYSVYCQERLRLDDIKSD
ncbi:MAG: diguanylate cyclase domain-containing protein [Vibrio sp.]